MAPAQDSCWKAQWKGCSWEMRGQPQMFILEAQFLSPWGPRAVVPCLSQEGPSPTPKSSHCAPPALQPRMARQGNLLPFLFTTNLNSSGVCDEQVTLKSLKCLRPGSSNHLMLLFPFVIQRIRLSGMMLEWAQLCALMGSSPEITSCQRLPWVEAASGGEEKLKPSPYSY